MFDKFSIAIALNYSLLLGIGLHILAKNPQFKKYLNIVLMSLILLICSNAMPFLFPLYNDARYSTRITGQFNKDYLDLVQYIHSMNTTSRFMWLPMNLANYVYVGDTIPGHYYFGPSPLILLSGATDYTGILSFGTAFDHSVSYVIQKSLDEKNYDAIGRLYQENNVGYVILITEQLSETRKKYLFDLNLFDKQNVEFKNAILGEKIRDFGHRYSLYSINKKYDGQKVYMAESKESLSQSSIPVTFTKINSDRFEIELPEFSGTKYLVFKDTFNNGWKLYEHNSGIKNELVIQNEEVRDTANVFALSGDIYSKKKLILYFTPERLSTVGFEVTIGTLACMCICWFILTVITHKKHE